MKVHISNCENSRRIATLDSVVDIKDFYILTCGFLRPKVRMERHRPKGRDDYQLIYIKKGFGYFEHDDEKIKVGKNHFVIYRPYERQKYEFFQEDNTELYYIHFSGQGVKEILEKCNLDSGFVFESNSGVDGVYYLKTVITEIATKKNHYNSIADLNLMLFFCNYARYNESFNHGKEMFKIQPAIMAIQENYMSNAEIKDYADMCSLSYSRFIHLFTQSTGYSPHEFRLNLRVSHAKSLLDDSDMSIQEISDMLGFSNRKYFSLYFKKKVGSSPSAYRNRHK